MKLEALLAAGISVCCVTAYAAQDSGSKTFNSEVDKISYTIGADMGVNFKNNDVAVNPEQVKQGLQAALEGKSLKLNRNEMDQTLLTFQKQLEAKHLEKLQQLGNKNKQDGDAFLKTNKAKPGVVALEDGLQYKVINPGTGESPKSSSTVTVDYEGRFIDGKVFDSSYQRGKPATFPLSQVIQGWQEALQLMKPGASWEIYVPPHLAYGEQGIGGVIGPNQTLIFKVDLHTIKSK